MRFYNITEKGFFITDESFLALVSKTLIRTPQVMLQGLLHHPDSLGEFVKGQLSWGAQNPTGRPAFVFFTAILMVILGAHDYVPFILNALLGSVSVIFVYLICLSVFHSRRLGLTASFLLAISNYHILYSRSGFPHATLSFFLLLGILLYLRTFENGEKPDRKLFFAGACLGFLPAVHYSAGLATLFFLLFDFISIKNLKIKFLRFLYIFSGILLVTAVFELILSIQKLFGNLLHLSDNFFGYLEEIGRYFLVIVDYSRGTSSDVFYYLRMFYYLDGYLLFGLFILGTIILFLKRDWKDKRLTLIFSLSWFLLIVWSLISHKVTRTLVVGIPLLSIVMAYAIENLIKIVKNKIFQIGLLGMFLVLIFGLNFKMTLFILNLKSGYKEASSYLKDKNNLAIDAVGQGWMHYNFYLEKKFNAPHKTENPNILISDWGEYNSWNEYKGRYELLKVISNPIGNFPPLINDIYTSRTISDIERLSAVPGMNLIGIFAASNAK